MPGVVRLENLQAHSVHDGLRTVFGLTRKLYLIGTVMNDMNFKIFFFQYLGMCTYPIIFVLNTEFLNIIVATHFLHCHERNT